MSIIDEFPLTEEEQFQSIDNPQENIAPSEAAKDGGFSEGNLRLLWAQLLDFGLTEPVLRFGTHLLALFLIGVVIWVMGNFYLNANTNTQLSEIEHLLQAAFAAPTAIEETVPIVEGIVTPELPPLVLRDEFAGGIPRFTTLHTTIPTRPRVNVIEYTVQSGDTVFGIAEKFGLRPETILWGNREILGDDPHKLWADQVLNILPVDGTYHKWSIGESFTRVADFYGVDPQTIIEWSGNPIEVLAFEFDDPNIEPGTWLIVPGGRREFINWGPPRIPRDNPAVAKTYGPGHCGTITDGATGGGSFIWPTTTSFLSGYDYSPATNHHGIDIAGEVGNTVYAADAGVVVYSGWSNFGYGSLVVLDHGNNWQSLYAHLSGINVICGQSLFQGNILGAVGSTGNSSGAHLHFELMYGSARLNPWNYVSP